MLVMVSPSEAGESAKELEDLLQDWAAGYGPVYHHMVGAADHVVVLLDNTWPKNDAVECVSSYALQLHDCEQDQPDAIKDPTRREANH
jgi:hypothetical protein